MPDLRIKSRMTKAVKDYAFRGAAQASYGSSKVYGASELAGNIYVVDQGDKREGQLIGPYGIGTRQHRAAIAGRQSVLRARYDAAL